MSTPDSEVTAGSCPVQGVPDFWEQVAEAREVLLMLDYDGTLAPFRVNRMEALPLDGVVEALEAIRDSERTRLAIVTGRPLAELIALTGDLGIPMAGSHGFEFLRPGGAIEQAELTRAQDERLESAVAEARAASAGARVERKPASVGLHTRGMAAEAARELEEAVGAVWSIGSNELGLECRRFSGGVELRLGGMDKGIAVKRLIAKMPDATLCVYAGDDQTDEDAFGALPESGIGVRVGPSGVRTKARGRLDDPFAVREFLRTWLRVRT